MAKVQPEAIKQANRRSDYVVFWFNVILSIIILAVVLYIGYIFASNADQSALDEYGQSPADAFIMRNIGFLVAGFFALMLTLVMIRIMRQTYLGNALQVEYSGYTWLRVWADKVAKDLEMPPVEIMITQNPVMNAFAFGFMKPYTIVLHSGTVRYASQEQLKAIVVHEMAHIKYKHTTMGTYANILRVIPGLGFVFGWMLDFWGRRAEFTADRLALTYLRNKEQVKEALICVHVGPDVAPAFNELARQWQVYKTDSAFNKFSQSFASHPFLVRRLQQLDAVYDALAPTWNTPSAPPPVSTPDDTGKRIIAKTSDDTKDTPDGTPS